MVNQSETDVYALEFDWTKIFLEIAARAIRRIHFEYGTWGAGPQWLKGGKDVALINQGRGIEFADERAVCAAITQEFMTSQATSGIGPDTKPRFFGVMREEKYRDSARSVDILLEKYELQSNERYEVTKPRSWVEAKRARLWKPAIGVGADEPEAGRQQIHAVEEDVFKLIGEKKQHSEEIYIHVLVWGVREFPETSDSDDPENFFRDVRNLLAKTSLQPTLHGPFKRWVPTAWHEQSGSLVVTRAAWVALAEINRPAGKRPVDAL